MRITNNILVGNMMKHLQKNMNDLDDINQKLASGKQFQLPSGAPIKVANSIQFQSLINNNEQYKKNTNQAENWLNTSELALKDAGNILQTVRELAVQGSNGTLTQGDRDSLALNVKELKKELINIANSQLGDRYLFSGQATATQPFDDNGNYAGDYNSIQREISPGIKLTINVNGEEAFSQAIKVVDDLYNNLQAGDTEAISGSLSEFDKVVENNSRLRAVIGAKINRLDLTDSRLDDEIINLKKLLSENEDIDIAKTITDLKMEESVYRASLATGARIMQPTLVDFLR